LRAKARAARGPAATGARVLRLARAFRPALALVVAGALAAACGRGGAPLLARAEVLGTMPVGAAALAGGGRVMVLRGAPGALRVSVYEGAPAPSWSAVREVALAAASAPPAGSAPESARRALSVSLDGTRALVVTTYDTVLAGGVAAPAAAADAAGTRAAAAAVAVVVADAAGTLTAAAAAAADAAAGPPVPPSSAAFDLYDLGSGARLGGFAVAGRLIAWHAALDLASVVLVTGARVQHRGVPGGEVRWEAEAPLEREVLLADGTHRTVPGGASIAHAMGSLVLAPPPTTGPAPLRVLTVGAGESVEARRYVGEPPCAISEDGTFLAARVGDDLQVYDVTAGKLLYTLLRAGLHDPTALTFFPGGRELLVERRGVAPAAYDWRTGAEVAVLDAGTTSLVIAPEGDRVLATSYDELRLYRVR
jgi:hypothetical protein